MALFVIRLVDSMPLEIMFSVTLTAGSAVELHSPDLCSPELLAPEPATLPRASSGGRSAAGAGRARSSHTLNAARNP